MTESNSMGERYAYDELVAYARGLFLAAGLDEDKAEAVATFLVEGDLMGHTTHGLQLAAPYLAKIATGEMLATGEPEVLADNGSTLVWDGRTLPGPWLVKRALDVALARAKTHGMAAISIRRSHHIGCLAAFLPLATDRGCMAILTCSDPSVASVAPYGGREPIFTPDPIAIGIPTQGEPILIDISASITTNGLTGRLAAQGKRLPGPWVLDGAGNPSDDPGVLNETPPGTILPIGGTEYGHKGFGLALFVEALTQALSGYGRADQPAEWGASVFVQVIDPDRFCGRRAFNNQTTYLAELCRRSAPAPGSKGVRMPGDRALGHKREALKRGVPLYPGIMEALAEKAAALGVTPPKPLA